MPIKRRGPGPEPRFIAWPGGLSWVAHPGEAMQRASHALAVGPDGDPAESETDPADIDLWLVDPVDARNLDDRLAERGSVAGVVVLSGYHRRDAAAIARRHDVRVQLPEPLAGLADGLEAPVEVVEARLPATGYDVLTVRSRPGWREAALYAPTSGTLVTADSLVSQDAGTGPGERLAVGPYVRPWPPRDVFEGLGVERILVGHGDPVLEDAQAALETALANARRGLPAYLRRNLGYALRAWYVALRS